MERMNREELIHLIESIPVDKEQYTILSSSALVLRGILESAGDLDLAVTEKGLEEFQKNYNVIPKERGWYTVTDSIECTVNDMKNQKEKVGEYYLEDIHHYFEYLQSSTREKDKARIPFVEEYIKKR